MWHDSLLLSYIIHAENKYHSTFLCCQYFSFKCFVKVCSPCWLVKCSLWEFTKYGINNWQKVILRHEGRNCFSYLWTVEYNAWIYNLKNYHKEKNEKLMASSYNCPCECKCKLDIERVKKNWIFATWLFIVR